MKLQADIEALLFTSGEALSLKTLAHMTGTSPEEVTAALEKLERRLNEGGTRLMRKGDDVMLRSAPECGAAVARLEREERSQPLGTAGFETLAIVLYRGPLSRSAIEHIRGVQSSSIVRTLLIRGLIEKAPSKTGRSPLYQATFDALAHLGITSLEELPEYAMVSKKLNDFEDTEKTPESSEI